MSENRSPGPTLKPMPCVVRKVDAISRLLHIWPTRRQREYPTKSTPEDLSLRFQFMEQKFRCPVELPPETGGRNGIWQRCTALVAGSAAPDRSIAGVILASLKQGLVELFVFSVEGILCQSGNT
jgi:hypothetical protein